MDTQIVTITDFIRKFGEYAEMLPLMDKLILTRDGRPFATLKATPQEKNKRLLSLIKAWDGRLFGNDAVWKAVSVRRNRKKPIKIW